MNQINNLQEKYIDKYGEEKDKKLAVSDKFDRLLDSERDLLIHQNKIPYETTTSNLDMISSNNKGNKLLFDIQIFINCQNVMMRVVKNVIKNWFHQRSLMDYWIPKGIF